MSDFEVNPDEPDSPNQENAAVQDILSKVLGDEQVKIAKQKLYEMSVTSVEDLQLVRFEDDFSGFISPIACRKLSLAVAEIKQGKHKVFFFLFFCLLLFRGRP